MTVKAKPFYWVECDGRDCKSRTPSVYEDISAWSERGDALDDASNQDWLVTDAGEQYCPNCYEITDDGDLVPSKAAS